MHKLPPNVICTFNLIGVPYGTRIRVSAVRRQSEAPPRSRTSRTPIELAQRVSNRFNARQRGFERQNGPQVRDQCREPGHQAFEQAAGCCGRSTPPTVVPLRSSVSKILTMRSASRQPSFGPAASSLKIGGQRREQRASRSSRHHLLSPPTVGRGADLARR